jgi:DNA-binding CsgD family transcriptional regulator
VPGTAGVTVAAIIVQTGVDDPESTSLTTLATQLADDVREILAGGTPEASVSAAVAVSGPLTALDRQAGRPAVASAQPDPIVVDRARRYATVAGQSLDLTYREFELLAFLADHPGHVFSRAHLLRTVWDHAPVGSRTVDVHVRRLRIKLGAEARRLTTVRNVGYRLESLPPRTLETVA